MRRIRTVILLSGLAATLGAQATTRPRTAVAGTVVRGADLVIDSLDFRHTPGIGVSAEVQATSLRVTGLVMVARVTNRGTDRWAASNAAVVFSLRAGRAGDEPDGASVVPRGSGSALGRAAMAPFGPFRAEARIPGSLAPGESRVVIVELKNRAEDRLVIFERDKFYTLEAMLRTRGDVNAANDRSSRVGRFDGSRGRFVAQWDALVTSTAAGGTVRVNAPPRP